MVLTQFTQQTLMAMVTWSSSRHLLLHHRHVCTAVDGVEFVGVCFRGVVGSGGCVLRALIATLAWGVGWGCGIACFIVTVLCLLFSPPFSHHHRLPTFSFFPFIIEAPEGVFFFPFSFLLLMLLASPQRTCFCAAGLDCWAFVLRCPCLLLTCF